MSLLTVLAFNGVTPATAQSANHAPSASGRSVKVTEGKSKVIKLNAKDPDAGQRLTFAVVTPPAHGQLTQVDLQKGKVTYIPDADFSGEDTFAFKANDGAMDSVAATIKITVYKKGTVPSGPALTAAEVDKIVQTAATTLADSTAAIAVVDRAGRILALYRRPGATNVEAERAVSLARTGAFFSNDKAPLSSRTVRFISGIHFPPNIAFVATAALYGIELTNRGCGFNTTFNPGKEIPASTNIAGTGPGNGITTGKTDLEDRDGLVVDPGGFPLYKNRRVAGGVGVTVASPRNKGTQGPESQVTAAEFSSFVAFALNGGLDLLPLPTPGRVILDGIELPFSPFLDDFEEGRGLNPPAGAGPGAGTFNPSLYVSGFEPKNGGTAPENYLVGPKAGRKLSAAQVDGIVQRAVAEALNTRAAIRLPIGQPTGMVIAVADLDGSLLALFRMPDATVFSVDVAVAKSRNVIWFSSPAGARDLPGVPPGTAVTNRTISFGAQPLYPPGINETPVGPFFDLFVQDATHPCTQGSQPRNPNQNGIVFFPGSAPLYINGQMVGGLGVSGDGVEQDDIVTVAGALGFDAPNSIRADQVVIRNVRLPYVKFNRNPHVP